MLQGRGRPLRYFLSFFCKLWFRLLLLVNYVAISIKWSVFHYLLFIDTVWRAGPVLQPSNKKMCTHSTARVWHVFTSCHVISCVCSMYIVFFSSVEGRVLYFASDFNAAFCRLVLVVFICFHSPLSWEKKKPLLCIPEIMVWVAVTCPQVKTIMWSINLRKTGLKWNTGTRRFVFRKKKNKTTTSAIFV